MKKSPALRNSVFLLAVVIITLCVPAISRAGLVAAWGDNTFGQCRLPNGLNNVKAVAAGQYHNLALRIDGTVAAWGLNDYGQTNLPFALSRVVAVSSGAYHNLALKVDGTVVAWGRNLEGQTNVPAGLSNVIAVAAGGGHNLALRADGTVIAWGDNYGGLTNVPAGLADVVEIAAGGLHNMALMANGYVVAWGGANNFGVINVPEGLSNVLAVAAGGGHSLALKMDGTVVAWGYGEQGQINVPAGLSNVVKIAAGTYQSLALKADGTAVVWGLDDRPVANLPAGMANVTALAGGYTHALALVFNGPIQITQPPQSQNVTYTSNATFSVVATGMESLSYQWIFNGSPISPNVRVSGTTNATLNIYNAQFADAGIYTIIVSNAFGSVISTGATLTVISPPFVTSRSSDQTVGAGTFVSLLVSANGTPMLSYQWTFNGTNLPGRTLNSLFISDAQPADSGIYSLIISNAYGVISTNIALTVTNTAPYFTQLPTLTTTNLRTTITSPVAIGSSAALGVAARGSLPLNYQWKFNGVDIPGATNTTLLFNQLRYDQSGYYNVEVSNAFGSTNSAKVLLNVSQVFVAGTPFAGNTNLPVGLSNVIAVAGGGSHIMALRSDGTVRTWLANAGYIYDYPYVYAVTNIPASVTNIIAISAGRDHCLALRSNGTVVAWGGNNSGQTNVPVAPQAVGLSNVIAIAAGSLRSYAVQSDGTVRGWGNQPAVPVGLSNVVAMACGPSQNLALKRDGTVTVWGSGVLASVPPGVSNVIAIAAGSSQNQALRRDGTIVTWTSASGVSTVIEGNNFLSNAVATACGGSISLLLKQDGRIAITGFEQSTLGVTSNISAIAAGGVAAGFAVLVVGDGSPNFTLHPYSQIVQRSNTVRLHSRAVGVQPMRYQWLWDNLPLPGATNSSLILSNVLGKDTGTYRMIASNALGTVASQIARVSIPFNTNLAAALNTNNWFWRSADGRTASTWFAQNRETHDGEVAAQSGVIANNQQSVLQTTITGPGTLRFWWKVSSEEGFDFLHFYLDNTTTPLVSISGETVWEQKTFAIPPGVHTLRWTYAKDLSVSAGRDAGWLDEVFFTPDPPVITRQPEANLTLPAGASAGYKLEVSGIGPFSYQWFKDGNSLLGATQTFLNVPGVNRRSSGTYRVQASNAGGSVMSSNAVLKVIVRQRMGSIHRATDGSLEISSRDADGGELIPSDLPLFEAQASTNLIHWQALPDVLSVTNGSLLLRDVDANHWPQRFYRVVEH